MDYDYSLNDWRYFSLQHNWGTSPKMKKAEKEYNAKYYQENKERILKKLHERRRNNVDDVDKELLRKSEEEGYDYKKMSSANYTKTWDEWEKETGIKKRDELLRLAKEKVNSDQVTEYEDINLAMESTEHATGYSPEVIENVKKNNEAVRNNIKNLWSTVEDYINANADKLTDDEIAQLFQDADQQANLELKRAINLDDKEGRSYVDDVLSGKEVPEDESDNNTNTESKSSSSESKSSSSESKSSSSESKKSSSESKKSSSSSETKTPKKPSKWHDSTKANNAIESIYTRANSVEDPKTDQAATDFGTFWDEVEKSGYEFGDESEALKAWKKLRTSVGLKNNKKDINVSVEEYKKRMQHSYNDWRDYKLIHDGVIMDYTVNEMYSVNDWRNYDLAHNGMAVEYLIPETDPTEDYPVNDWRRYSLYHSWGTKPDQKKAEKEYNHKYWEEHKEEIMKKRQEKRRSAAGGQLQLQREESGRDFKEFNKSKADYVKFAKDREFDSLLSEIESDIDIYKEGNSKHTEYSPDVLKNIEENNKNVMDNIKKLSEEVQKFIEENADKLSEEEIITLNKNLDQQIALEEKRIIDLDSSEGREYVDGLLGGGSSGGSGSSVKKNTPLSSSNKSAARKMISNANSTRSQNSNDIQKLSTAYDKKSSVIPKQQGKHDTIGKNAWEDIRLAGELPADMKNASLRNPRDIPNRKVGNSTVVSGVDTTKAVGNGRAAENIGRPGISVGRTKFYSTDGKTGNLTKKKKQN